MSKVFNVYEIYKSEILYLVLKVSLSGNGLWHFCTISSGGMLVGYSPKPVGSFPLKAFPNTDQLPLVIFCHCYNAVPKGKLSHKGTSGRIIESQSFVSEGNFEFNLQIIGIAIELYV